ncbi:MAG: rod shape-determining protein MreD [Actinomycetes bacterium]
MTDVSPVPRGRLAAVALLVLVIQTTVISQVPPFAGAADIVPLAAMSIGLLYGSLTGAFFGFGIGLGLDLLLVQPLGQYALLNLAVGYSAGRLAELRPPSGALFLIPLGACAVALTTIGFGILQVMFGGGASLSGAVVRQTAIAVLWGGLLAVPVNAAVARLATPGGGRGTARRSRRRAYATGGLSPLTPGRKR